MTGRGPIAEVGPSDFAQLAGGVWPVCAESAFFDPTGREPPEPITMYNTPALHRLLRIAGK